MIPEAPLEQTENGVVPRGDGWFVVNAREAPWGHSETFGSGCDFENRAAGVTFPEIGVNIGVLQPGQPNAMYHGEEAQEGFLVLSGECLLVVEGQERPLRAWDYVHLPPWTEHILVGAGSGPCVVLAFGSRGPEHQGVRYPVSELALRHGAGVRTETTEGREAYAPETWPQPGPYRSGTLPDL